jgi:CubicO group peptidase (beta-lactamase class C family)
VRDVLRHRSGLSHLKGVTKDDLLDHLLMEERLAAAPVDHLRGWPAYHALTVDPFRFVPCGDRQGHARADP